MFIKLQDTIVKDFNTTTLIMPALSVGSVGTLAIELLILNHNIPKVGYYKSKALQPIIQIRQSKQELTLQTAAEIFQFGDFTILQINNTLKEGRRNKFIEELKSFLETAQFKEIILFSSLSHSTRPDHLIGMEQIYFVTTAKEESALQTTKFQPCEKILSEQTPELHDVLAGVGLTSIFMKHKKHFNFPFTSILTYASSNSDTLAACALLKEFVSNLKVKAFKDFSFKVEGIRISSDCYKIPSYWNEC